MPRRLPSLALVALPITGLLACQSVPARQASTAAAPAAASPAAPADGAAAPADVRPATATTAATSAEAAVAALGESPVRTVLEVLGEDAKLFNEHVVTLSNPFFEGRVPGSQGNRFAASYIEFFFRRAGLKPAFPTTTASADGTEVLTPFASYRQPFQAGSATTAVTQEFQAAVTADGAPATTLDFASGKDFNAVGFSATGTATGPLVFAGYAVADGPDNYNTFYGGEEKPLAGKVAIVLRFEPINADGKSKWGAAQGGVAGGGGRGNWSPRSAIEPKVQEAARRGAAAIIIVNPPGADDERVGRLEDVNSLRGRRALDIPVVMLSTDAADRLVRAADAQGRSLEQLRSLADNLPERTNGLIDLPRASVTVNTVIQRTPTMTDNVAAVLPGKGDLADQYVVIGGHYDHLGYGFFGSREPNSRGKLHPGADDNASGTAGVLIAAEKLAQRYAQLPAGASARSVLFMAFCAEESGLNGARFYVNNPIVPVAQHTLMINMDMIGRMRENRVQVGGVGTAEGFLDVLTPLFNASGINVRATPGGTGPSDHSVFFAAQMPVLFFFTGLHDDYHKPADMSWTLNQKGAARIINLVTDVAFTVATRSERLAFISNSQAAPLLGSPGDRQSQAPQPGPMRMRVRFGIAPGDYSGSEPGVLVGEVTAGTSAAEAGLQPGDLMTAWNGTPIPSVEAWMTLLTPANPGDKVNITYRRDGKEFTTTATLKARQTEAR